MNRSKEEKRVQTVGFHRRLYNAVFARERGNISYALTATSKPNSRKNDEIAWRNRAIQNLPLLCSGQVFPLGEILSGMGSEGGVRRSLLSLLGPRAQAHAAEHGNLTFDVRRLQSRRSRSRTRENLRSGRRGKEEEQPLVDNARSMTSDRRPTQCRIDGLEVAWWMVGMGVKMGDLGGLRWFR